MGGAHWVSSVSCCHHEWLAAYDDWYLQLFPPWTKFSNREPLAQRSAGWKYPVLSSTWAVKALRCGFNPRRKHLRSQPSPEDFCEVQRKTAWRGQPNGSSHRLSWPHNCHILWDTLLFCYQTTVSQRSLFPSAITQLLILTRLVSAHNQDVISQSKVARVWIFWWRQSVPSPELVWTCEEILISPFYATGLPPSPVVLTPNTASTKITGSTPVYLVSD